LLSAAADCLTPSCVSEPATAIWKDYLNVFYVSELGNVTARESLRNYVHDGGVAVSESESETSMGWKYSVVYAGVET
jgi:hypothetical protein